MRETQFLSSRGLESRAGLCHKICPLCILRGGVLSLLSPHAPPWKVLRSRWHTLPAPETVPDSKMGKRTTVHLEFRSTYPPWSCPESFRGFWNTVSPADTLSQNRECTGEVEVPVCRGWVLHCLLVSIAGIASPPTACHLPLGLHAVLELAEMTIGQAD